MNQRLFYSQLLKNTLKLAFVSLIACLFLSGNSANSQSVLQLKKTQQMTPPEIDCIKKRGEIVVCMYEDDRVPFFMDDENGNVMGQDADLAKMIAEALGVQSSIVRQPSFNGTVKAVASQKCDIAVSKLSKTVERAQQVLYSKPYVNTNKVLVINRLQMQKYKSRGDESIDEILKKSHQENNERPTIAVARNSSYEKFATRLFPDANLKFYDSWTNEAVPWLYNGEIFAVFTDEFQSERIMRSIPHAPLRLLVMRIKDEFDPLYIVAPFNAPQIIHFVNAMIEVNSIETTQKKLFTKYKKEVEVLIEKDREFWKEKLNLDNKKK